MKFGSLCQRYTVRSIFLGHFIPFVLQPTMVKFLFIFNCMSVSLCKLSTVKWSTFIGFLNTDLLSFFVAAALLYFKHLFSFLFLFNFFFLLQCIDVTWRRTSINCFLFGRLDRMIAPWGGTVEEGFIYFHTVKASFLKRPNPFLLLFHFVTHWSDLFSWFNLVFYQFSMKKKKKKSSFKAFQFTILSIIQNQGQSHPKTMGTMT